MARHHPQRPVRRLAGFTLVEVLVAVTVLGLVIVAVTTVMHTAIRSWRAGHAVNEIVQTARITKDAILGDMHNMVFMRNTQYNQEFQRSLFAAASQYQNRLDNPDAPANESAYDLARFTPPIDLSFRVQNGGNQDRLTFVRSHRPRFAGDPETWAMRRVQYAVSDGTLFRKEEDPFGYRPGQFDESLYNATPAVGVLAEFFMKQPGYDYLYQGSDIEALPANQRYLPPEYELREPLCVGVETFDITLGYFKQGHWQEVGSWDSSARQYRQPPRVEPLDPDADALRIEALRRTAADRLIDDGGRPAVLADPGQPDDLPGYIVIRLGLRDPVGGGRLHVFTFFDSLPMAQELDVLELTDDERAAGYFPPVDFQTQRHHER